MTDTHFEVEFFCVDVARTGITTSQKLLSLQDNIAALEPIETSNFSFGISDTQRTALPLTLRKSSGPLPKRFFAARRTVPTEAVATLFHESGIHMNRQNQRIGVIASQRTGETNVP